MKKIFLLSVMMVLMTGLIFAGCAAPATTPSPSPVPAPTETPALSPKTTPTPTSTTVSAPPIKPIQVDYVTFLPTMTPLIQQLIGIIGGVEKKCGGQITFKCRGGPEAISPFDQPMAVKTGTVQMAYVAVSYYAGLTAAPGLFNIAQTSGYQDRETGAYDFLVELHDKVGLRYIIRACGPPEKHYNILTTKNVDRPQNLAGLRMAGGGIWETVGPSLGMKTVAMEVGDFYGALERGVIDAAGNAPDTLVSQKLFEVSKYMINHPFMTVGCALIMEPKKWNSIPKDLQVLIINAFHEAGPQWEAGYVELHKKSRQTILNSGIKPIDFTDTDAQWFTDKINSYAYDFFVKKAPVDGPKLWAMLQKDALKK